MNASARQSGFALIMVLLLVAAAAVLGTGYLLGSSVKTAGANNLTIAERARYLAESGLQHALFLLQNDPQALEGSDLSPLGPYYVDGSADGYYFSMSGDPAQPGFYTLVSESTVGGLTRQCTLTVYYQGGSQQSVPYGMFVGGGVISLPATLRVNGDMHLNGSLLNLSQINGNVTASGTLWDPFRRIRGSTSWVAPVAMPEIYPEDYSEYLLGGKVGVAHQATMGSLSQNDNIVRKGAITAENPGGVVILTPDSKNNYVTIGNNVEFKGTLIVLGDLLLNGKNVSFTATEGFPALIVEGRIFVDQSTSTQINGLVVAPLGFAGGSQNAKNSSTLINGGLVCETIGYDSAMQGSHTINYQEDRCNLYSFGGGGSVSSGGSIEILDYN